MTPTTSSIVKRRPTLLALPSAHSCTPSCRRTPKPTDTATPMRPATPLAMRCVTLCTVDSADTNANIPAQMFGPGSGGVWQRRRSQRPCHRRWRRRSARLEPPLAGFAADAVFDAQRGQGCAACQAAGVYKQAQTNPSTREARDERRQTAAEINAQPSVLCRAIPRRRPSAGTRPVAVAPDTAAAMHANQTGEAASPSRGGSGVAGGSRSSGRRRSPLDASGPQ